MHIPDSSFPSAPPRPENIFVQFDGVGIKVQAYVKKDKLKQLRSILEAASTTLELTEK